MIDKFLDYLRLERNYSVRTVDEYGKALRLFESYFCLLDTHLSWETLDSDVIRGWMESMMDKGNTATSVKQRLSAVRSFYRFLLRKKVVEVDPSHGVENPKAEKPLPTFLTEKDMEKVLDPQMWDESYKSCLARTIIILLYETGVRASELMGLDWADVDFARSELKVTGKRNKQRLIPFGAKLEEVLKDYKSKQDSLPEVLSSALFVSEKGRRLTYTQLHTMVRGALGKVVTLKKRSPHVLRHTFATAMLNHDAALQGVQKLLGHESLATTEIYTHTTFDRVRKVYQSAHPRD